MSQFKILVVDDDPDVRETIADVLARDDIHVTLAENGRVALDALRAGLQPDVILLDMMMPEMDGWTFRAEQLRSAAIASIPVVVFTAHGAAHETAHQLSAHAFLKKPVRLADLLATLNQFRPSRTQVGATR